MFDKILSTPTAHVGRVGSFMIFQIKLWLHCFRLLKKNRSDQQAAALSYYTLFGIVPLAVVMLMVFQFGTFRVQYSKMLVMMRIEGFGGKI